MTTELAPAEGKDKKIKENYHGSSSDTVYAVGLIGAWIYYIGRATTTEEKIKGFFKGFAWPAILVYRLLEFFEKEEPASPIE
ncbi:MAG: hypothetical protein A2Z16_05855 [Chloroflexi bacterium RBG_16_54_18]|nr:MAG: hypothetical protein A2Z16_05855 [Chloroflexi bacterium RBG_16_54_18]